MDHRTRTAVDDLVLKTLHTGRRTAGAIFNATLGDPLARGFTNWYREVGRSLQRLSADDKIRFGGRMWSVINPRVTASRAHHFPSPGAEELRVRRGDLILVPVSVRTPRGSFEEWIEASVVDVFPECFVATSSYEGKLRRHVHFRDHVGGDPWKPLPGSTPAD